MAGLHMDILLLAPADTTFPSKQQSEYTGPSLVTWRQEQQQYYEPIPIQRVVLKTCISVTVYSQSHSQSAPAVKDELLTIGSGVDELKRVRACCGAHFIKSICIQYNRWNSKQTFPERPCMYERPLSLHHLHICRGC